MWWQILETKVSVKVSQSHFLTILLLNSLFTRSWSIFLAVSTVWPNAHHSAKLFLWLLRFGDTHGTLWRGNHSCNCIAIKHRLQLVFMHWRSRWACCKLIVLKRWCPDRKVKRTSRNLWNLTIRRHGAWQNIWNVFHLSLSLAALVVSWLEVFVTGCLYYLIWLNVIIL